MTEIPSFIDHNYIQTFEVYVDGEYAGIISGADIIATTDAAQRKFFVRQEQNITLKNISNGKPLDPLDIP